MKPTFLYLFVGLFLSLSAGTSELLGDEADYSDALNAYLAAEIEKSDEDRLF